MKHINKNDYYLLYQSYQDLFNEVIDESFKIFNMSILEQTRYLNPILHKKLTDQLFETLGIQRAKENLSIFINERAEFYKKQINERYSL